MPPGDAAALRRPRARTAATTRSAPSEWAPPPAKPSSTSWSVDAMVRGYERLIASIYRRKAAVRQSVASVDAIDDYVDAESASRDAEIAAEA